MRKKILSLALALAVCLGLMAVPAAALSPGEEWMGDFVVNGDTLVKYYGEDSVIAIPSNITKIEDGAFQGCTSVTSVSIPSGVTKIGIEAFQGCTGLTSVTIPSSVDNIQARAFSDCTGLKSVNISSGVKSISSNAFSGCTSLASVTIPSSVTEIFTSVFSGCSSLTDVTILPGVTKIGNGTFANCTSLTSITIPSGVTNLGENMFIGCTNLTNINLPSSLRTIGSGVFYKCTSLTSVNIPSGVSSIGTGAFWGCTSLTSLTIPSSVESISTELLVSYNSPVYTGKLTDIYFGGSQAQWKANRGEGALKLAKIDPTVHFNSTGPSTTQPTTPVQPQQPAGTATASPTNDKLEVNGKAANPTVYKIGDSNYFKIRDVAALLDGTEKQFAVGYDGTKNAVTATTGQGYAKQSGDLAGAASGGNQSASASNDAIYVNGEKITAEVYKIGGSNYFKLRDLGKALNFYVGWSADRGMYVETDKPYSE